MKNFKLPMLALVAALTLGSCATISPQEVGIKVSKAGNERGVSNTSVANGYVLYNPIATSIVTYPRTVQGVKWDANNEGEITFRSNGGVRVSAPVAMNFQVKPDEAPKIYAKFGRDLNATVNRNLKQIVQDSMNRVGSQYTPMELVGSGSVAFEDKVKVLVSEKYDEIGFTLVTFSLPEGIHPPKSISDTIDATQKAKQEALRIQNELASTKAEAEKVVAKAQGEARAKIAAAQAEAQATLVKAEAQAKANRLLASSVTPTLVQYQRVQKWDGKNPTTVLGSESSTLVTVK